MDKMGGGMSKIEKFCCSIVLVQNSKSQGRYEVVPYAPLLGNEQV